MSDLNLQDIDLDALTADNEGTDALGFEASNLINTLGAQIAATQSPIDLGADPGEAKLLIGLELDNSPSMGWHYACGDASWITTLKYHGLVAKTLLEKKVPGDSEMLTFLLNQYPGYVQQVLGSGHAEFTWANLSKVPIMLIPTEVSQYLTGGTPLYERSRIFLASIKTRALYWQQTENIPCRSVSAIISDGGSTDDVRYRDQYADECKLLIAELRKNRMHRVLFVGIDDGSTDFVAVATRMGIPAHDIRVISQNTDDLGEFFLQFSQMSVTASQTAGPIDHIKLGN
ncbi:hypothetical protein BH10CYA1_BH10CYA1_17710 [soil metagenome]